MNSIRRLDNQIVAVAESVIGQQYRDEIERAIKDAKRLPWDKWCRLQFYRAAAQRRLNCNNASRHAGWLLGASDVPVHRR